MLNCASFIEAFFTKSPNESNDTFEIFSNIPIEIIANYADCQAQLKNFSSASFAYDYILSQNCDDYIDVIRKASDFFDSIGEYNKALEILEQKMMSNILVIF